MMAARDGGVPRLLDASMVDARLEVVDERMQSAGILREGMQTSSNLSFTKHASALTERLAYAVSDADVSPDAQNAHALLRASAAVSTGPQDATISVVSALETVVAELQARRLLAVRDHEKAAQAAPMDVGEEIERDDEDPVNASLWKLATSAGVPLPRRVDAADVVRRVRASKAAKALAAAASAAQSSAKGKGVVNGEDVEMEAAEGTASDASGILSPSAAALARSGNASLVQAAKALDVEYAGRREMVLTRLRVTLDAFLLARRLANDAKRKAQATDLAAKGFADIAARYGGDKVTVPLSAASEATASDVAALGAVSGHVDGVAQTAVKRVRIGRVPDRGGRPGAEPPSRVELGGWGGGRGGGGRGGRGGRGRRR